MPSELCLLTACPDINLYASETLWVLRGTRCYTVIMVINFKCFVVKFFGELFGGNDNVSETALGLPARWQDPFPRV